MTYEQLETLAAAGKLRITKRNCGIIYRDKGWRGQKWDDTTNASWSTERIPYTKYSYEARTLDMQEHQCYKITKKDFINLSKYCNTSKL